MNVNISVSEAKNVRELKEKIQALQKENAELREIAKQFKETIQPVPEFLTMDDISSHFKEMRFNYLLTIDRLLGGKK